MKRAKKYNIIIYTSLSLAIVLLLLGGRDYFVSLSETPQEEVVNEVEKKPDIKRNDTSANAKTEEPLELQGVDKVGVVTKYLDSILDQIHKDDIITYKMIKTWGAYEVGDIEFQREITSNYYEYIVNINIPKMDAKLPSDKNEKLSTEQYIVLSLYFDLAESERVNGYIVKNVDIIEE